MNQKRILSLLLAAVIVVGAVLGGCGSDRGSGSSSETKTETKTGTTSESAAEPETAAVPEDDPDKTYELSYTGYWCDSTYEPDNYVETMIEEALNLDIHVEKAETSETIDLLLSSNQMPDCMWSDKPLSWMLEQELIRSIPRAMVEKYCPRLIEYYNEYPLIYEKTLDPENDQEFRCLTGLTFQFVDYYLPGDYYRYDWIENLGIDLGVNVEQLSDNLYVADDGIPFSKFEEIMDAFVNGDPDGNGKKDTVGMTGPDLEQGQYYSAFGFSRGINDVDGRAEECYATEAYKEYLKGFADLHAKGLVDPEIITGDRTLSWDKVNSGVAGYWVTSTNALNSWAIDRPPLSLMERNPEVKILMTPGIKPDGGEVRAVTNESPAYGNFYVNAGVDDEKLARILRFLDYTLFGAGDRDIHATLFYGEQGVDWEWDEAGEMPVQLNTLASGQRGTWSFGQFGQDRDVTTWTGEEPLFNLGAKYWSAGSDGLWMQWLGIPYKADLANETDYESIRQEIRSDLDAYVANYRTQAFLGQIDVDSTWEEYLGELDRLGYNRMMDELEKVDPLSDIIASYEN